jgi:hypothetical protein
MITFIYIYNSSFLFPLTNEIKQQSIVLEKFSFEYKYLRFYHILNDDIGILKGTLIDFESLWKSFGPNHVSFADDGIDHKQNIIFEVEKNLNPFQLIKFKEIEDNRDIQHYLKNINIPLQIKTDENEFEKKIRDSKFINDEKLFFYHDSNYLIIIYRDYIFIKIKQKYVDEDFIKIIDESPFEISKLKYFNLPFTLYGYDHSKSYNPIFDEIIFYLFKFQKFDVKLKPSLLNLFKNKEYDILFMYINLLYLSLL